MSFHVFNNVTIYKPSECERMVLSEQDNGIFFYPLDTPRVLYWQFSMIRHVSLISKRENKVQIKFDGNEKREIQFRTLEEMLHFLKAMKIISEKRKLKAKVVQPPVRGEHVKEVVQKFESLSKKNEESVKPTELKRSPVSEPSKVKVVNDHREQLRNAIPSTSKISAPTGIMKAWAMLTPKSKKLTISDPIPLGKIKSWNPAARKSEVTIADDPKPEVPKPDVPKPEVAKSEVPKPEVPKPEVAKPEVSKPEPPKTEVKNKAPLKPKRRAPQPPVSATQTQPKPEIPQKPIVEKKLVPMSDMQSVIEQIKQKDIQDLEKAGYKVIKRTPAVPKKADKD